MNGKKIALVTGAAGLAGSEIIRRFKADGYVTAGIDLSKSEADVSIVCDVTKRDLLRQAAENIENETGEIAVLCTAAGPNCKEDFVNTAMDDWRSMLDVWLRGTLNACAAVAPFMLKRRNGRIIALSADYAGGHGEHILDAAAASAVHGFVKSFACEVAPMGVIANVVYAGVPFDQAAIAATASFLANRDSFIVGQALRLSPYKA